MKVKCEVCGKTVNRKPSALKKSKHTYCSNSCRGKVMVGDRCPWWKGGITDGSQAIRNSAEYKEWRTAVFSREDYTCGRCKQKGGRLEAHHLLAFARYPELRLDISNGVTLCKSCHHKFHKENGTKSFTVDQLEEFIA